MVFGRFFLASALASLTLSSAAQGQSQISSASFMEDNDLWKEDNLEFAPNRMTQELFNHIIDIAKEAYKPFADAKGERLTVNAKWEDATVNANARRMFWNVSINMYGGLARRAEVTPDAFALVLCHELGHAYGGEPYVQALLSLSSEGQSDYYGMQACLQKVIDKLEVTAADVMVTPYTEAKCGEKHGAPNTFAYNSCLRKMSAGQSLGNLLAVMKKEPQPNYQTPDSTVVDKTLTSYPEKVQCRLDTYHNGAMDMARPACWFSNFERNPPT